MQFLIPLSFWKKKRKKNGKAARAAQNAATRQAAKLQWTQKSLPIPEQTPPRQRNVWIHHPSPLSRGSSETWTASDSEAAVETRGRST